MDLKDIVERLPAKQKRALTRALKNGASVHARHQLRRLLAELAMAQRETERSKNIAALLKETKTLDEASALATHLRDMDSLRVSDEQHRKARVYAQYVLALILDFDMPLGRPENGKEHSLCQHFPNCTKDVTCMVLQGIIEIAREANRVLASPESIDLEIKKADQFLDEHEEEMSTKAVMA